jgi:hypothetical protein
MPLRWMLSVAWKTVKDDWKVLKEELFYEMPSPVSGGVAPHAARDGNGLSDSPGSPHQAGTHTPRQAGAPQHAGPGPHADR